MNEATKPLLTFSKLNVFNPLRPPLIDDYNSPLSAPVVETDPRETAQSTVQHVTARAVLTSSEEAAAEAPLLVDGIPDHAAKSDDERMNQPEPRS